jgi:hypothetical protein
MDGCCASSLVARPWVTDPTASKQPKDPVASVLMLQ